jgi:hypothetical protein
MNIKTHIQKIGTMTKESITYAVYMHTANSKVCLRLIPWVLLAATAQPGEQTQASFAMYMACLW